MSLVIKALGSRPVSTAANWLTRNRLRVLTYHGVPDPIAFAHQMDLIAERYSTVNGPDVIAWLDGLRRLPKYALWITFDDGDPSVIDIALPLMKERELVATAFICPGLVDTTRAQWWDIAAEAVDANVLPPGSVVRLKRVADAARRAELAEAAAELTKLGRPVTRRQWSQADVDSWVAAGNEIGNHTWDHPCLDRCSPEEQELQIRQAHDALTVLLGSAPVSFAWPNGNVAQDSVAVLRRLGYRLVLPCDHRLVSSKPDPMAISRLRIDADAGVPRARAIMCGAHSAVFHLGGRVRRLKGIGRGT